MGGVFNRAEGLSDEVKADLFAANVSEAIQVVTDHPVRVPKLDIPEPGRRRKRKRAAASTPRKMRRTAGQTVAYSS
jgi:hypothetical protein